MRTSASSREACRVSPIKTSPRLIYTGGKSCLVCWLGGEETRPGGGVKSKRFEKFTLNRILRNKAPGAVTVFLTDEAVH